MNSFGHWDYAETFTGREAAYLIAGLDPSLINIESDYKIRPIIARMKASYYETIQILIDDIRGGVGFFADTKKVHFANVDPTKDREPNGNELWSFEIQDLIGNYNRDYQAEGIPDDFVIRYPDKGKLSLEKVKIYNDRFYSEEYREERERWTAVHEEVFRPIFYWACNYIHEFDEQKFGRAELHRWITQNNLNSQYKFLPPQSREIGVQPQDISTNERNTLLVLIAALCKKAGIDPTSRQAAGDLVQLARAVDVDIDDGTVRSKLKQLPDALAARRK